MTIEFSNIQSVSKNDVFIKRAKSIKRYNYSGIPNIKIELVNPIGKVKTVFLGVDQPPIFIHTVKNYMDEPK